MRKAILALVAIALTGCTSSAAMKKYVGEPLVNPVLRNGPPTASYDMGDGRRAFVWENSRSLTMPGTATTNANATLYGMGNMAQIYGTQTTTYRPPNTSNFACNYVLYAEQTRSDVEGPAAWTVVGYEQPDMMCE